MSLVAELKRRNVFRVATAYLVVGWLLTEVLTTVLPTVGAPEWISRAVILAFALGFVPAVALSWLYELTPEGIKRESDIKREDDETSPWARKLDYITIAAVVLIIVFVALFGATNISDETEISDASDVSVAVLPFLNLSAEEDNEYFSDGLTETLLHVLAQNPRLEVAARTSSFAFKGKNDDVREIARALQVAHILEGSVQRSGERVRITAQLIRAADGFHVWSNNYDRTIDDIFEVQDEIANEVGNALEVTLLGEAPVTVVAGIGTDSTDAFDLYLQAINERKTFSYGGLQAAEQLLKGALAIDPDFSGAKRELAIVYLQQFETGLLAQQEAANLLQALTDQVLAEHPDDIPAQAMQVFANAAPFSTASDAIEIHEAVAQLENLSATVPNEYQVSFLLTRLLSATGRPEDALAIQQRALEQDPYNASILYEVGSLQLLLSQHDEARTSLRRSLDIEPQQPNAYLRLANSYLQTGNSVAYLENMTRAMSVDPRDHEIPAYIAVFLYQLGLADQGDEFANLVEAIAPTSPGAYRITLLGDIARDDRDAAIASARRTIEDGVSGRMFAFSGAVQYLLRHAVIDGRVQEEIDWLEAQVPGLLDVDRALENPRYIAAQISAFDAWYTILDSGEIERRIEVLRSAVSRLGADPFSNPQARVAVYALTGDTENAIETALADVFTQPVTVNMDWRDSFAQPAYADFVADPRVQGALNEWEQQMASMREDIAGYLAELSESI